MNIIIYTRVSTDEQATNGHGRDYQMEVLKKYCAIKGYKIIAEFEEDHSAKNFNRPEWQKLETYVKVNRKDVDIILFTKWDRFSRNIEEALTKLRIFDNWGIQINAVEQMLDFKNPDNKMMLSIYLVSPEIENDKISKRTRDGMHKAAKDGAWLGTPPYGYKRHRFGKFASLLPNDDSNLVRQIFKEASIYVGSLEALRKDLKSRGYTGCKQSFYNMLKNKVYTGMTKVPQFEKEDSYWIDGLHDGIIDIETYDKVQNIFSNKTNKAKFPSKRNDDLPMRGFLECEFCGNTLTGSPSKGNGGVYYYYHCRNGCKNRISSKKAHKMLKNDILKSISVNDNVMELYKEILIDTQQQERKNSLHNQTKIEKEIERLISAIQIAEDKLINGDISSDTFDRINNRYNENLRSSKVKLQMIKDSKNVSVKTINKACETIRRLPQLFDDGNYEAKTSLLGLIFPDKLIISQKGCRTKKQNKVIELLTRVNKASQELGTKKAIISDGLSSFAPPLGLYPNCLMPFITRLLFC